MRRLLAVILSALILTPIQATGATGDPLWSDAREGTHPAGTIGGLSIPLSANSSETSVTMLVSELPTVVEVYTATWCLNCISTEHALDEAIGDTSVSRIHYHRHWSETEDPFGSDSTEERWENLYGTTSTLVGGLGRLAPTTVFDGERLHLGTAAKSGSLQGDYSTSLAAGSTHPYSENSWLRLSLEESSGGIEFSYVFSGSEENTTPDFTCPVEVDCHHPSISRPGLVVSGTPYLLFVEDSAYFPNGSNEIAHYLHVMHKAVPMPTFPAQRLEGSMIIETPTPWDGDDMSAVLVYDWAAMTDDWSDEADFVIPAPGIVTLLCMLAALVPRRTSQ